MSNTSARRAALAGLAVLLAVVAWFGWETYQVYTGVSEMTGQRHARTTWEKKRHFDIIPPLDNNHRFNFLVLGSDNDTKLEEKHPLSQSMIIVTVDPRHDKVGMLSIPRDFWVPIPGHGWGKIDLAYKYGGVSLARETVERLFGIPINFYAWVGLDGFIKVVDTFHGVTLDVQYPVLDDGYPNDLNSQNPYGYERIFIPAGWQHLDGATALEYVRSRHGDIIGDFGRSERQQQVLLQLDQKINALDVLLNLPQLVADLRQSVRTDLSPTQLFQFARLSRHLNLATVQQVVLQPPVYSHYGTAQSSIGLQSVVVPNWQPIRAIVKQMFAPIAPLPLTSHPAVRPHSTKLAATPTPTPQSTRARATPSPTAPPTPTATSVPSTSRPPGDLVYVSNGNLFEVLRSGTTRQLTYTGDAAMPAVSPDGRSLAFIRFGQNVSDLWVMDLKSRHMRRLTDDTNPLHVARPDVRNNLWAAWPQWSPDGTKILFSWDAWKLQTPPSDSRPVALALYEIPASGGTPTQLTQPAQGGAGDTDAAWRPHSSQILYVRWDNVPASYQPYSQLELRDTASGASWALTSIGGRVLDPSFSPDGSKVAFLRRQPDGTDQIVVAPLEMTSNGPQLGPRTVIAIGEVGQPAFSPDGRWISFVQASGDGFQIYLAPVGGGQARLLTAAGSAVDGRWRPVCVP